MAAVCDACPPKLETLFADLLALERCTDADYDRATDAIASGAKTEAELMSEWAPMGLEIGTLVKIKNLKSRPELNGCEATVIDFRIANRRYGLQLSGGEGEKIAVKPDNIQEVGGMDAVSVLAGRLGADVAGIVGGFMTCTRCLEPCVPGSKCRVPHPTHLRTELGMMSGPDGMRSSFGCNACEQQYVRVTPWERTPDGKLAPAEPRFEGSQWCFAGVHTTAPVPASDRRRVYAHTVALVASATLQQEIDALPADVQTLTITSGSGFYDESLNAFTLERHLPELRELQLVDVSFAKIVLNSALTPSVQSLRMQNVPDECDLTIELPNLKSVSIHFLGDCDEVINTMLEHATSLERFDSYKLWAGELHFASNELVEVDLHRSDSLETLTLYAPNLRRLGLQACYGLNRLTFRTSHPTLSSGLPHNCTPPPLELALSAASLSFNAPVIAPVRASRASVSMKVEDLVGGINDPIFGGTPEGKIFDPLGLGQDEAALYRRRVVEIKHGRICMVAFLGMTVGPADLVKPTHALLSPSADLHFDDIPGGIAAIGAVPAAGWFQIIALVGLHEVTIAKQDYTKAPGEIPTFLGFKPEDPAEFKSKQLKELKNGRLAMIAVLGELMAQQVSGMGTYEQLGAIVNSLPIPL